MTFGLDVWLDGNQEKEGWDGNITNIRDTNEYFEEEEGKSATATGKNNKDNFLHQKDDGRSPTGKHHGRTNACWHNNIKFILIYWGTDEEIKTAAIVVVETVLNTFIFFVCFFVK